MKAAEQLERARVDPVWACRELLRFEPWSKQQEILEAVRDHERVAVRSANSTGKTSIAGRVVLTWLAGGPGSIVVTTAPTYRQVTRQLWREVRKGVRAAKPGLFGRAALTEARLEIQDDWFAVGLSSDEPESFQGWHEGRVLVIVDEASGVSESVYEAVEGVLAGGEAKILLLGNPTRVSGQFFRSFHSERHQWHTIAVSAFDTPAFTGEPVGANVARGLVTRRWVDDRRAAWGESSPLWAARVLGQFPSSADDTVIGLAELDAARARQAAAGDPVVVACDVARFGADETVIAVRRGNRVRIVDAYSGRDLMQTVGRIIVAARSAAAEANTARPFVRVVIDDAGVGGGVTDRLRELQEFPVFAFNGGGAARLPEDYPNRRSEAWFRFAEALESIDLDRDEQLAADLVAPRYQLDSRGRRVVEQKAETKRRLGRSPDRADAVLMAFAAATDPVTFLSSAVPMISSELERRLGPPAGGTVGGTLTGDIMRRAW